MRRFIAVLLPLLFAGCVESAPTAPGVSPDGPTFVVGADDADHAWSYTSIDVPGATFTSAFGINARGDVVGGYSDATGAFHGYRLQKGVFTTIDYPGAQFTEARGIGPSGEIVGQYGRPGEPAVNGHGFLLTRKGEFVPVDFPGHTNTIPQRILPDGTILGCRHDQDTMGSMRGILISGSWHSESDVFASMHNGATPDLGRIVGRYLNENVTPARNEGYVIDDGVFTALLVPGSTNTQAWDVNPAGEIAGLYRDATGFHGFVLTRDGYVSLDVPGATATRAFGINARGDVVGTFLAGGRTRAFVASKKG